MKDTLGVVFNILKDHKLFANEKKCVIGHPVFGTLAVGYLVKE